MCVCVFYELFKVEEIKSFASSGGTGDLHLRFRLRSIIGVEDVGSQCSSLRLFKLAATRLANCLDRLFYLFEGKR